MPPDVDANVAKWRKWIEKDIRDDIVGMHFRRLIRREITEMMEDNPEVGDLPVRVLGSSSRQLRSC